MTPPPDWTTYTGSSLISIGTHRLHIHLSGQRHNPKDPLVIILTGAGDVASSHVAVEPPPVSAAQDLHSLLQRIGLAPPLVLVAHSYGGIVAREYLHAYPEDVAGMVLSEAATERTCDYFRVPDPDITAVVGELRWATVTGLRDQSVLSREQWRQRAIDISRGAGGAALQETSSLVEVCQTLAEKNQFQRRAMGSRPLGVIRCNSASEYERVYATGVAMGNGTPEQQGAFRDLLDRWEGIDQELTEEQLRLSSRTHLVRIPDCGHNVHLVRPDVVAAEIRWVLDRLGT
ncbi:hypothetical protein N7474_002141 [Penicillium riverlandense]|uniref:uncharacterized protein n=1 Tax=Penicillium riverlandense TaxID=1903569 RepID=UPI002546BC1A|nr:uncharacterized protein N7474_002141 [Penicillium riverlandense]KAJ5833830.1 hypothetical protein N7474_002141 [Penicillium riverlandense]